MYTQTKDSLQSLTPKKAFELLTKGNQRFVNSLRVNRNYLQQVNDTSEGQYPFAIVLSCIDSRTSAELIFDQGLGDIFSVRIAGNVLNGDILGSMEYACAVTGSKLIVVLGHSKCGAVTGACNHVQMGNLSGLLQKIQPAIDHVTKKQGGMDSSEFVEAVSRENVLHQMDELLERSSILRDLYEKGKIGIVGGTYSVETGEVEWMKEMFSPAATPQANAAGVA